jgi:hypothetical protein
MPRYTERVAPSPQHLNSEETEALRELARPSLTPSMISEEVLNRLIKLGYAVNTSTGPEATPLGKHIYCHLKKSENSPCPIHVSPQALAEFAWSDHRRSGNCKPCRHDPAINRRWSVSCVIDSESRSQSASGPRCR